MYNICSYFVMITDLIKMGDGMKVAPVEIEETIKAKVDFLSNVMLIGDCRKFLTCLVTLKVKTYLTSKKLVVLFLYIVCCGS